MSLTLRTNESYDTFDYEKPLKDNYDVIVIGGGPAGLSAALILGRSVRSVLVCDSKQYRNLKAEYANGFLSRDHIEPEKLRSFARSDLGKYNIDIIFDRVLGISGRDKEFKVNLMSTKVIECKKIVLATGLSDILPDLEGLRDIFGKSAHLCPYCDGWESRDKFIAVHGKNGADFAINLMNWSSKISLFTDGVILSFETLTDLSINGVKVYAEKIEKLISTDGQLEFIELKDGRKIPQEKLFLQLDRGQVQKSSLAETIGLKVTKENGIEADESGKTSIPGIFVCGDASKDLLLSIVGAGEGARVGVEINKELLSEDRKRHELFNP